MRKSLLMVLAATTALVACSDTDGTNDAGPVTVIPTTTVVTDSTPAATTSSASPAATTVPTTAAPDPTTTTMLRSLDDLQIEAVEVATGFEQPVLLLAAPGDTRNYVVDQPGVVYVMDGDPEVFLDIRGDVRFGGEQGLLGLAFHPQFDSNGRFYVHYTADNGDTVIEEFLARDGIADVGSRSLVLRVDQPAGNHNGGMIAFGPDGNLWIGLGDGGGSNDQFGHGQRADTLLGTMLRISPTSDGYSIPAGNLSDEIWGFGLRNPWRWAFDGDDLWIGDVGQNRIEEVDVVDWTAGNPNFGWSIMEGSECFREQGCSREGLTLPVYEYTHGDGCSITGGAVYRGAAMPELGGQFFFGDYCTGWVRTVDKTGAVREWLPAGTFSQLTSFGVDSAGEIYVLTAGGSIYILRPGSTG